VRGRWQTELFGDNSLQASGRQALQKKQHPVHHQRTISGMSLRDDISQPQRFRKRWAAHSIHQADHSRAFFRIGANERHDLSREDRDVRKIIISNSNV
jgi:hypothetical protein